MFWGNFHPNILGRTVRKILTSILRNERYENTCGRKIPNVFDVKRKEKPKHA